jgi:catalase
LRAKPEIISKFKDMIKSADGKEMEVEKTFLTAAAVMYDVVYVPGGKDSVEMLKMQGDAIHFVNEAFKHCKAIAATGEGVDLLVASDIPGIKPKSGLQSELGVVTSGEATAKDVAVEFIKAIAQHRHWQRVQKSQVPA